MEKHPHLFLSFSKTARNFPNIFQADTLEFHAYAEVEMPWNGEILRWIPTYPPTSPKTDCYVWKMCCYLWLICRYAFLFLEGISFGILILEFKCLYYAISTWYPYVHPTSSHWRKSRHQGERELIDMESHCPTTIHQPPTALQKVIRDYSSEGKNFIPLIKDFTKTTASTCQTQSQMFNRKSKTKVTENWTSWMIYER